MNLLQCQSQDPVPSDDEYSSSTNIAISLFKRYRNALDRGGSDNLKVANAYEVFICCELLPSNCFVALHV